MKSNLVRLGISGRKQWKIDNPLYSIWYGMIQRCTNPKLGQFKDWGGRGITVCPQWIGKSGYLQFVKDIGDRPSKKHSLDRQNNDGNYEPGNCKWSTKDEQMRNTRSNRFISHLGKTQTIRDWAVEYGIDPHTLRRRIIKLNWSVEEALSIRPGTIHKRIGQARGPVFITHNGETLTLAQWSVKAGISEDTIYSRHRSGVSGEALFFIYSMSSAVTSKRNKDAAVQYQFLGESRSLPEWAVILHIPLQRLYQRINRRKWTLEKAFTSPASRRGIQAKS